MRATRPSDFSPWISRGQIKGLLARRNRILELVDRRIAERGEAAVLYP